MKFMSTIIGASAVLAARPDFEMEGETAMLRGKFEAVGEVDFLKKVELKHGPHFDLTCAKLCFLTPGCRFDPHEHWSYCKYDHHPAVCFGLYRIPRKLGHDGWEGPEAQMSGVDEMGVNERSEWGWGHGHRFGKLCYQPTQPHCPEKFPVYCRARPYPHKYDGMKLDQLL